MIQWSQPEILLYSNNLKGGMSYPDLIEENGNYWVTETQKSIARVHAIDSRLLNKLWNQGFDNTIVQLGLIWEKKNINHKQRFLLPKLPGLKEGSFSIEVILNINELIPGQIILENTNSLGNGLIMRVTPKRTIELLLKDGEVTSSWDTDPGTIGLGKQHIVFVVDGLANLMTTIVNGKLCDGGRYRYVGWNWFDDKINNINGTGYFNFLPDFSGKIIKIRIYNRYLLTSEAISNYHAEFR
jgi:hypothetical protein